jgi:hypothetical protein
MKKIDFQLVIDRALYGQSFEERVKNLKEKVIKRRRIEPNGILRVTAAE